MDQERDTRIGLVGCTKSKLQARSPAKQLYMASALFRGRRRCVERTCDRWFILSAKHGLVDPDTELEPYDETLVGARRSTKRAWADRVLAALLGRVQDLPEVVFECHAGADYLDHGLADGLLSRGASVERPVDGLSLGRQLSFYGRA